MVRSNANSNHNYNNNSQTGTNVSATYAGSLEAMCVKNGTMYRANATHDNFALKMNRTELNNI